MSEPILRSIRAAEKPRAADERQLFGRMADWVQTGLELLTRAPVPGTRLAVTERQTLLHEGETLHQNARQSAAGRPPTEGPRGLWQRIRSWLGRVQGWVRQHLPPRRQDRFLAALEALRTEMQTEIGQLRTELRAEIGELRTDVKTLQKDVGTLAAGP